MNIFDDSNVGDIGSFAPTRAFGPFTVYITVNEVHNDELEITAHPIQLGAPVTDHAYKKQGSCTLKLVWGAGAEPLSDTYKKLLQLQSDKIIIEVVTGKRRYPQTLIKSLGCTTDAKTENILAIDITIQEITIVNVITVGMPPRNRQKKPAKTASTDAVGKKALKKSSALNTLGGFFQ